MHYKVVDPNEPPRDAIHAAVLLAQAQAAERQKDAKSERQRKTWLAAVAKKKRRENKQRRRRRK